jgi:hypothetical protein
MRTPNVQEMTWRLALRRNRDILRLSASGLNLREEQPFFSGSQTAQIPIWAVCFSAVENVVSVM